MRVLFCTLCGKHGDLGRFSGYESECLGLAPNCAFQRRTDVKGRILLVDDEQDVCELLSSLLKAEGAEVDCALDEAEAAELLGGGLYDTVLTDLNLGAGDGLNICNLVSRMQPGVPVIVVTGYGSFDAAINAIRAGAYDFITKPIDAAMVVVAVERALEHRRVRVQLSELEGQLRKGGAPGQLVGQCAAIK